MAQMSLFNLPSLPSKGETKDALNKVKKSERKAATTAGGRANGKGIETKIKLIEETAKKYFENDTELITIQDENTFRQYMNKVRHNGILSLDTETEGLDPLNDKLAGLCLYTPGEKAAYVPVNHISYITGTKLKEQVSEDVVIDELKNLNGVDIILHNAKFDIKVLRWQLGEYKTIDIKPSWDTMIGAFLLNENELHGLKYLHTKYVLKKNTSDLATYDKIFDDVKFTFVPPEIAYLYAAKDAKMTYELYLFQKQFLDINSETCKAKNLVSTAELLRDIELPLIPIIADMEDNGVSIDTEYAKVLHDKYTAQLDKLEIEVQRMVDFYGDKIDALPMELRNKIDYPFNISSPTQLSILLYDVLKLQSPDKNKPRGTGEEIIASFDLPICEKILEYRGVKKLLTTYIDKLPNVVNPRTGKIHASFHQYGAACITEESLIVTDKGMLPIVELVDSDLEGEFVERDINIVNMQNQIESASHGIMYNHCSTITIETRLGFKLTGTPNHLVIANRHGKMYMSTVRSDKAEREFYDGRVWKNLEHLSSDDYICIPYGYNVFSNEYIQLNSKPLKVANQGKQDIVIPSILNEELAEFMGIYYADGTWDDSNGSFTIRIHNSHSEVIERVKYLAKKLFNIEAGYDKTPSINITGKALRPIVELLNLQKGCTNKQISELILKSPRNVVIAYIKGMTLDGHAEVRDKEKRTLFNLTVSNELSARYMQSILLNLGIVASLEYALPSDPNTYSLEVTNEQYALFRDLIGFEQSKDYIYAQNWGKPNNKYRNDRNNKVIWVNIKKITHGVDNVYDLHVPQTHSFISNGMISHNTGRFSSSDPNLQNIPSHNKEIRKMFVADPGNVLVGGDFSQQEPRLLAHMSGDEHMIEAYLDGKDIYATIAAKVYHLPYEQCLEFNPDGSKNPEGKKRRQNTKSIVLGIMYGRGANSIAEQTGMSKEEAQAVIDGFFSAFPKIKNFVEGSVNHAKQYGYVDTVYGRKRRLPDIQLPEVELSTFDGSPVNQSQVNGILFMYKNANSKKKRDEVKNKLFSQGIRIKDNGGFIAQAERQCVNSRIQGGGADISKKAMVLLGTNEELKNLGYKILLTVHDEVIGMCPKENAKKCAELMKSIMIASCKDKVSVPMKVDTEITYCWYGEEIELN